VRLFASKTIIILDACLALYSLLMKRDLRAHMDHILNSQLRATARTVALWTAGFAAVHSVFASRSVKGWIVRRYGETTFNGLYRICFNGLALTTFAGLLVRFSRLPDRQLYRVPPPWSLPMRLLQVASIAMLLDANIRIGVGRMSGLQGLWQWLWGDPPIVQNPAQGPQLDGDGDFRTGGAFTLSRHPNNLAPLILWVAHPKMTVRFATFILVSAIYLILGSVHEESRLRAAYGKRYDRYRSGKPFYLPLPHHQ
jgi:hypothetical protein